ncbi:hypothetical protein AVEN_2084-1 [Araneus ventricosus]|uniref:Uncharacterized protein n=1 Tax=Araneus ventricosus TaxID=182803 RepID=A0A4Y2IFC0_ARAVE|nr:hypothetical protein AVEN_2084-1 [Araneus ventricosus]
MNLMVVAALMTSMVIWIHYSILKLLVHIYGDLDSLFNPEAACLIESKQEGSSDVSDFTKTGNTTTSVPSQSSSTSNFSLNEDQLKKEEMILYLDLVVTEMDNKKALLNLKTEYMKLKKETDALRKSLSEKDEKISQLTAEVVTLKKNVCSLYKTANLRLSKKTLCRKKLTRVKAE